VSLVEIITKLGWWQKAEKFLFVGFIYLYWSAPAIAQSLKPYSEIEPDQSGNFLTLLSNLVLPNIPGALLLLIMSTFFSSINFFSDNSAKKNRTFRGAGRYFALWVSVNYFFALLILLLILPENVSLESFSRTLFVYCLLATALPELSANIRLQFGQSDKAIDLYKYKSQVSGLISDRVATVATKERNDQLIVLANFYYGRPDEFLDRLNTLIGLEDLSKTERESLELLSKQIEEHPVEGDMQHVFQLGKQHMVVVPRLLAFFESDIKSFRSSASSSLMKQLRPHLNIDEARGLVGSGVTSSFFFLINCWSPKYRERIAERTGITLKRIEEIFFNSRFVRRQQVFSRLRWATLILLLPVILALMFSRLELVQQSKKEVLTSSRQALQYGPLPNADKDVKLNSISPADSEDKL